MYIGQYMKKHLNLPLIISNKLNENEVWTDYTLDELTEFLTRDEAILGTHTLAHGWLQSCLYYS